MFQSYLETVDQALTKVLVEPNGPQAEVYKAARYSLLSGGKRLRPLLVLVVAKALSLNISDKNEREILEKRALEAAIAVELIHTYSLIHDDLPGMDNDDFRRGKPTLHKVFTEGQAILAGDLLLTHAFERLASVENFDPLERLEMIKILSRRSGGEGMIGGQSIDLSQTHQNDKSYTKESLDQLHKMKTGALIQAAVELGAISAKAPPSLRDVLSKFAMNIGLAFQIIDDVLDVTNAEEKHGRLISSDFENEKNTYVSLIGIESSKKSAEQILHLATNELNSLDYDFNELKTLANQLVYRKI